MALPGFHIVPVDSIKGEKKKKRRQRGKAHAAAAVTPEQPASEGEDDRWVVEGEGASCSVEAIEEAVQRIGVDNVLCVATTSSCFAPRTPDLYALSS